MLKSIYLQQVYSDLTARDPEQKEFHQAVREVLESLDLMIDSHPEYREAALLERFVDAVIPWDTDLPMTQVQNKMVSLISDNYKKIYSICSKDKDEAEKLYLRLLLVTDYICGMTDSYAKDLYQELNGIV